MEQNEQFKKLRDFFCEKLDCKEDKLIGDTDLTLLEGYNSMMVVELILFIEENFDIEISDDYFGLENYKTIDNIQNIINSCKA